MCIGSIPVGRGLKIPEAMPNWRVEGEAFNNKELLKHIVIKL